MQPCEAHLRDRAGPTANDQAGVTGQCHEEVSGVTHAAGYDDRRRPVGPRHFVRCDDADDQSAARLGTLGRVTRRWTATSAKQRNAKMRQQFATLTCEIVGRRPGFSTSQYTHLRSTMSSCHSFSHD